MEDRLIKEDSEKLSGLLVLIKGGNEKACHLFFNEYKNMVASLAFRFLGPEANLSEMVQNIFIEVFKSLYSFRGDSNFKTWLYRICANTCYKEIRKRQTLRSHFSHENRESLAVADSVPENQPENLIFEKERKALFSQLLQTLEPEKRMVLLLHDVEELPLLDVSKIVEVPLGTVKSRLFHARIEMREKLKAKGIQP